jgi:hypothetical protein
MRVRFPLPAQRKRPPSQHVATGRAFSRRAIHGVAFPLRERGGIARRLIIAVPLVRVFKAGKDK